MSGDTLGKRIHELRGDRQSMEWAIENLRAKGEDPPECVLAELAEVCEALLVELDARAEKI